MEIIIVLAIVGIIIAFLVMQRRKELKGEAAPVADWPVETKVEEPVVVEAAAVVATAEVAEPVVVATAEVAEPAVVAEKPAAKAKKPRKPKAVVADDSAVAAVKKPRKPRSKKV